MVGALHLDVVVDAPHLPALDETVTGHKVSYRFGGKGGNQAAAAARMGARVAMAGRVGRDWFGEQLLAALDAAAVDRSAVEVVDGASGMSVAIVEETGDYGAVIVSGVNRELEGISVPMPETLKVVLLQNEVPEAVNLAVAARLRTGVRLILNAGPARPIAAQLLGRVDVLIVNRVEATAMSGTDDPVAAAKHLSGLGPSAVIVTLGGDGLVLATAGGLVLCRSAPGVAVISTHGAGDAFTGALAAELARGASMEDALSFAQGAAALAVSSHPDARGEITAGTVRKFLNGQKFVS